MVLKLIRNLVLFVIFISVISCVSDDDKNETGDLKIQFKLMYGNVPLEMFKKYNYPQTGDTFYMTRLSFFISNIKAKALNSEVLLKEIDYVNLTDAYTSGIPSNGFEYQIKAVKTGTYDAIQFGIGVPKESNALAPKDFPSSSVLSGISEYWSSWKSYIFFRPEGKIALDKSKNFDTDFALHLGSDNAYRTIDLSKKFTISSGNTTNFEVIIDMEKFFKSNTFHDIGSTPQIHSLSQMPVMVKLADNLLTAVK